LRRSSRNHAYIIRHKLQDCNLMKSFMATRSLPRGTEVIEDPIEDDAAPFPVEDAVMMDFRRSSPPKKHHTLDPSKGAPSRGDQIWGDKEM
jgi:hypothetical protein